MKNVFKTSFFYLMAFAIILGNSVINIDFSAPNAHAEELEIKPEVLSEKLSVEPYPVPVVQATASSTTSGVFISWNEISDKRLDGYKVVMSEINTTPSYPADGYIAWITDYTQTNYTYTDSLACGQPYYFSMTARYDEGGHYEAGNAITIEFACEEEPEPLPYCGDGINNQEWEQCDGDDQENLVGCSQQCQYIEPSQECNDLVLARVNIDEAINFTAVGDMTSDIFLGSDTYKIPEGTWFPLYWNGSYFNDPDLITYEDVPGMAVQRVNGSVRTVLHGSHINHDKEHVHGNVEFYNATVIDQLDDSNDVPVYNGLDNAFDGTGVGSYLAGNDEVWIEDNKSYFWLTTTSADDGFYTTWDIVENCNEEPYCGDGKVDNDLDEQCDDGNTEDGDGCNASCQPELEPTPYAPWCSALLGVMQEFYNPDSSVYSSYNKVIDMDGDGVINLIDDGILGGLYYAGDNKTCYAQFEDPEDGYNFQCEDPEVGWCGGLVQGIKDSYGSLDGDDNYFYVFDLNDDGVINLIDLGMVAKYNADSDQAACYTEYVPPFLMCVVDEPYCGDGKVDNDLDEQCDDGNTEDGDGCNASCQNEGGGGGGGGGGTTFAIRDLQASPSCGAFDLSWRTTKYSDTILDFGIESGVYNQNINNDTNTLNHNLQFSDLSADTTYYYKIRAIGSNSREISVSEKSFTTPPAEQCGEVLGKKIEAEPEPLICDFLRPSGSKGGDLDVEGVFQYPDGSLLRDACVPEMPVYLLRNQKKWHVPTWQYLYDNNFGQRIYNVLSTVIQSYPDWTGEVLGIKEYADGTLLRGSDMKIYILKKGQKQHIKTLEELAKYLGQEIINVDDKVLKQY